MTDGQISPKTVAQVWAAAKQAAGKDGEPFAPCPPGCDVPPDIHRHYQREPGVYYHLAEPAPCCGREWMREDEYYGFDTCTWCRADGNWFGMATLIPAVTPVRDMRRRP
jgi:hypothetical protein